jgi:hypothetical protein
MMQEEVPAANFLSVKSLVYQMTLPGLEGWRKEQLLGF